MNPLAQASDDVRQVREWLLRPSAETLDACVPALERAAAHIAELVRNPPQDRYPGLVIAAAQLASEVAQAQKLLAGAVELHFGRLRQLSSI